MRAVFVDANPALANIAQRLHRPDDPSLDIVLGRADITPDELPAALVAAPVSSTSSSSAPARAAT